MGDGVGGQILELEGDGVAAFGEAAQGIQIVVGRGDAGRRDLKGGRIGRVVIDAGLEAQPRRRQRQHPAQLAAAYDSNRAARRDRPVARLHLGFLATERVCLARQASSVFFTRASDSPRMAAA